ncbi:MAG: ABC transporter permease [Bacteroidetes bacterium]|nr:ABC transporter permease [Bacteroidota bacterium]
MQTVLAMIRKEFLQLRQDKKLLALSLVAPIFQVVLLSYAARIDVKDIRLAIIDPNPTVHSREIREKFEASGLFTVVETATTDRDVNHWLDAGKIRMALILPADFSKHRLGGNTATVQLLVDGADGNTAGIAVGYAAGLLSSISQSILSERIDRSGLRMEIGQVQAETRVWYNPELETMNFMVPGVLSMVLLIVTTLTTALSIVKEKENGNLEQLIVTPIRSWEIMLGKMIPYSITATIVVLVILGLNSVLMEAPFRGSFLVMMLLVYVYLITTLGLGLLISTVSNNQQQAALTAVFILIPPMVFFSGFIFPVENMPTVIQWISTVIPMKYFLVIIRGIFLKGVGLETLWPEFLALFVFSVIIFSIAVFRFRKTLD